MTRTVKLLGLALVLAVILSATLTGVALADGGDQGASWGEPGEGAGPGLQNCWGNPTDVPAGTGECQGASWGEPGEGAGQGLQNCWGKNNR